MRRFAPHLKSNAEALDLLLQAIEKAGYRPGEQVALALDVAATELYKDSNYAWDGDQLSSEALVDVYSGWCERYPIVSIEDGLSEDDWEGWEHLTEKIGSKTQLVGDDLFVTNPTRLKQGIDQGCANSLLVKVNQIGTLKQTREAIEVARAAKYTTVMSHRSGVKLKMSPLPICLLGWELSKSKPGVFVEESARLNTISCFVSKAALAKSFLLGARAFRQGGN